MEESDEDDNIQVIVFGNSSEAKFDDFYREEDIKKEEIQDNTNEPIVPSASNEQEKSQKEDVDLESKVQNATKENKVFMKYDYTHEKPWSNHSDKSMWFNYNFDENSFKEWVQKHIDRKLEKQQNYQIENTDNYFFEDNIKSNIINTTSTNEYPMQNIKTFPSKNMNPINTSKLIEHNGVPHYNTNKLGNTKINHNNNNNNNNNIRSDNNQNTTNTNNDLKPFQNLINFFKQNN
ncbi:conserved Plasmodium protein, unknown function [Plasmodium sp. gorilla clade G2]|uniref:conserved Plasmodium protein, unknown function n=1 Tax=Plasmodium sp. gorilla clade G2 TaxID=880535 RepID=UPI000D22C3A4|nr:conserved Plasmodium protein, unknown function [Plasmodium sp. gorilla clade G2]SOV14512.1 conserved Plasmodium protein, unknown function [Plasmodium sp. gorilla clade G2]